MQLKVMTYNIYSYHNLRYEYKPADTIAFIKSQNPDIVGINEMDYMNARNNFTDMPKVTASGLGFQYYFFGKAIDFQDGEYGNTIVSRYPIISRENHQIPELTVTERKPRYEPRAVIKTKIDCGKKVITVLVSHYGLSEEERIAAAAETVRLAEEEIDNGESVIFMGDLNCSPDAEELRPLYELFADTDNEKRFLTHPSDDPKVKIDYIFATKDIELKSLYTQYVEYSDHLPLIAVFEI